MVKVGDHNSFLKREEIKNDQVKKKLPSSFFKQTHSSFQKNFTYTTVEKLKFKTFESHEILQLHKGVKQEVCNF